jgi:hypothetical protein
MVPNKKIKAQTDLRIAGVSFASPRKTMINSYGSIPIIHNSQRRGEIYCPLVKTTSAGVGLFAKLVYIEGGGYYSLENIVYIVRARTTYTTAPLYRYYERVLYIETHFNNT